MKSTLRKKPENPDRKLVAIQMNHRLREGFFLLAIAASLFLIVSFLTYHSADPGWSNTGLGHHVANWGGRAGAFLSDVFLSIFGLIAYVPPFFMVFYACREIKKSEKKENKNSDIFFKSLGFIFIVLSGCGLATLYFKPFFIHLPAHAGGIIGDVISQRLVDIFNFIGAILFLTTAFLCGITLFTGFSWIGLVDVIRQQTTRLFQALRTLSGEKKVVAPIIEPVITKKIELPRIEMRSIPTPTPTRTILPPKKMESSLVLPSGELPPLSLLDVSPPSEGRAFSHTTFEALSQCVEQRLLDFGVVVKVVAVHPGPIITRFELELAPGIKVSKISGLAKDIARSLSAISVRIVEVIPGKSVIGLELPNEHREVVCLRDILESQQYIQSKSPVSLALGKEISGEPIVVDLSRMPHLLVAGTTGSGKSVSINAMLLSMLFKATPDQLRLILIDPKMLELSIYEGIPHLLTPVITDMKDAANALRWCVAEMERRYKLMASLGVRNLASYNQKIGEAEKQHNPLPAPAWLAGDDPLAKLTSLPTIVVVADELADMMMVVGKKVEDLITRIAQKARAAGIHLIVATQRPSVDVITGLIKANIPTRIAFQVSSRIDSRTILDQQGAEQLLGNGDMLYLPPGGGVPIRVHGAFVADDEVHRVVAALQSSAKPEYLEEVTQDGNEESENAGDNVGERDVLYDEALRIVTESRRASISLVQRRLKIGYNRAATIMETMEAAGVVSGMDSSGSREVLAPPPVEL